MNWSRNKQSTPEDPNQANDPLDQFTAPTVRRKVENVSNAPTQPLNPNDLPGADDFGTTPEFSNRSRDRVSRQLPALRINPIKAQRFMRSVNNRQLFIIAGGLLAVLALVLLVQASRRNSGGTAAAPRTTPTAVRRTPLGTGPSINTTPGSITLATPVDPGNAVPPPVVAPAGAQSFTVFNTETFGLKIRDTPSTSGNQIGTFPDGTKVEAVGGEQAGDGYTWIKVKGPQGEGWVAKEFLQPVQ